jgi:hypothetical protein
VISETHCLCLVLKYELLFYFINKFTDAQIHSSEAVLRLGPSDDNYSSDGYSGCDEEVAESDDKDNGTPVVTETQTDDGKPGEEEGSGEQYLNPICFLADIWALAVPIASMSADSILITSPEPSDRTGPASLQDLLNPKMTLAGWVQVEPNPITGWHEPNSPGSLFFDSELTRRGHKWKCRDMSSLSLYLCGESMQPGDIDSIRCHRTGCKTIWVSHYVGFVGSTLSQHSIIISVLSIGTQDLKIGFVRHAQQQRSCGNSSCCNSHQNAYLDCASVLCHTYLVIPITIYGQAPAYILIDSPSPEVNMKKNDPGSCFLIQRPPCRKCQPNSNSPLTSTLFFIQEKVTVMARVTHVCRLPLS